MSPHTQNIVKRASIAAACILAAVTGTVRAATSDGAPGPKLDWKQRTQAWAQATAKMLIGKPTEVPDIPEPKPGKVIPEDTPRPTPPPTGQVDLPAILAAHVRQFRWPARTGHTGKFVAFWPNAGNPTSGCGYWSRDKSQPIRIDRVAAAAYRTPAEARAEIDKLIAFRTRKPYDPSSPDRVSLSKITLFRAPGLPEHKACTSAPPDMFYASNIYFQLDRYLIHVQGWSDTAKRQDFGRLEALTKQRAIDVAQRIAAAMSGR